MIERAMPTGLSLSGKNVCIVGLGLSGVAAAELCLRQGAKVTGVDRRPPAELGEAARGLPNVPILSEAEARASLSAADLVVVSPGVENFPGLLAAEGAGVPVIGEIELAARLLSAPLCAVGGTNGKSTTTELVAAMLARDGRRVFCGGNLGTPLATAVGQSWDALVVEVSSFQLERAPTFRPRVSVLLNITDDHLDRHGSFESYAAAKGNAFANQQPDDVAIAPFGDAHVERQVRRGAGRVCYFGPEGDYVVHDLTVLERDTGEVFSLAGTELMARYNQLNAAAAIAAARALGATPQAVRGALVAYQLLPHRLAWVSTIHGVRFYNDSKATNVGAAVAAIDSLVEPKLVLIAGGKGKDGSYEPLVRALERRGRALILIGEAAPLLAAAAQGRVDVELAPDLDTAVERAYRKAQPEDAVLLAPACASFDMFKSYAERGERFVEAVRRLASREAPATGDARR